MENKILTPEDLEEKKGPTPEEVNKIVTETAEEVRRRRKEALEAAKEGKGILHLEVPIKSGDGEITDLPYDFTALTGMEYADAMDIDPFAKRSDKASYRQSFALFAKAAAKQVPGLDMKDIMERMSVTDTVEATQLGSIFFLASAQAGFLRISKKL